MRTRRTLRVLSTPILVLVVTALGAVALCGHAGARATDLSSPTRSSQEPQVAPLSTSTEVGRIAFASGRDIFLINSDGSGLRQLTQSDSNIFNYQPALSPDGTQVAFASVQGTQGGISIIDVDGTGLRTLTVNNKSYDSEPAWSPDGSKIAFVRGFDPTSEGVANFTECGPARIYVVNVDIQERAINLTPDQSATDPSWSPDGRRIAFASNKDGNYDIFSMTSEGADVQQLTSTHAQEAEPSWSPDGKMIAYASGYAAAEVPCGFIHTGLGNTNVLARPDIYVMSIDGSTQTRLTETENNLEPTWSPDGASLAFVSFHGNAYEICVLDAYHKTAYCITSDSTFKSSPSWSRADPPLPPGIK